MANEVKAPSVPIDYFGPSYQQLIHADNLIQKGNSRPAFVFPLYPSFPSTNTGSKDPNAKPQTNYVGESDLWERTRVILKSLIDQETKIKISERIVDI